MLLRLLQDSRVDPAPRGNRLVALAAAHCDVAVVEALLADAHVDPAAHGQAALCAAAKAGGLEIMERPGGAAQRSSGQASRSGAAPAGRRTRGSVLAAQCCISGSCCWPPPARRSSASTVADHRVDSADDDNVALEQALLAGHSVMVLAVP